MAGLSFLTGQTFDPTANDPLPAGTYNAIIIDSIMKDTKNNTGKMLECTFQVLDGAHAGRIFWDRFNLINANDKAVEIAQRQFAALCAAVGFDGFPKDSQQLHNKPLSAKMSIREQDGYAPTNEVKQYKPPTAGAVVTSTGYGKQAAKPIPAGTTQQQREPRPLNTNRQPQQAAQGSGAPPWAGPAQPAQDPIENDRVAQLELATEENGDFDDDIPY